MAVLQRPPPPSFPRTPSRPGYMARKEKCVARCRLRWAGSRCQPAAIKSSYVAAVSWWLALISRKREEGEERGGHKKEGAMEGGEEEQRATLTVAPQASNSGGDGNSLSFFCPSFFFPLPVHVTPYLSVSGRPVHTVFLGRRPLPFIPRSYSLLSSRTSFFLSPQQSRTCNLPVHGQGSGSGLLCSSI